MCVFLKILHFVNYFLRLTLQQISSLVYFSIQNSRSELMVIVSWLWHHSLLSCGVCVCVCVWECNFGSWATSIHLTFSQHISVRFNVMLDFDLLLSLSAGVPTKLRMAFLSLLPYPCIQSIITSYVLISWKYSVICRNSWTPYDKPFWIAQLLLTHCVQVSSRALYFQNMYLIYSV
jgi:hypothetical protein